MILMILITKPDVWLVSDNDYDYDNDPNVDPNVQSKASKRPAKAQQRSSKGQAPY